MESTYATTELESSKKKRERESYPTYLALHVPEFEDAAKDDFVSFLIFIIIVIYSADHWYRFRTL
jgi:hypothetical protein